MKVFDSIIIGAGPAGLSMALGLGRQTRSCLVVSHQKFRNDGIEASHAVLGHDHVHPQGIWARARKQIERYENTTYATAEITAATSQVLPEWDGRKRFEVTSREGQKWYGKTLVLASGVKDVLPDIKGYEENWPRNIYQCLFCDGWERRTAQKAILCLPKLGNMELAVAAMAWGLDRSRNADESSKVAILTNGNLDRAALDKPVAKKLTALTALGFKIDERKVVELEDAGEGVYMHLQNDADKSIERVFFGFIVHKPRTALNVPYLIEQLGLETEVGMFGDNIKSNGLAQATNVAGVFTAGDAGNALTHVTTAMSSGVGAAGGIVHYLNDLDIESVLSEPEKDIVTKDRPLKWKLVAGNRI